MSRSRLTLAAVTALTLVACAPHELPVTVKQCDVVAGSPPTITVKVFNGSTKPVVNVGIALDFYHDYKFTRVSGAGIFTPPIRPNYDATTSLPVTNPKDATGSPQRCAITHITYADGTQEDAPK